MYYLWYCYYCILYVSYYIIYLIIYKERTKAKRAKTQTEQKRERNRTKDAAAILASKQQREQRRGAVCHPAASRLRPSVPLFALISSAHPADPPLPPGCLGILADTPEVGEGVGQPSQGGGADLQKSLFRDFFCGCISLNINYLFSPRG